MPCTITTRLDQTRRHRSTTPPPLQPPPEVLRCQHGPGLAIQSVAVDLDRRPLQIENRANEHPWLPVAEIGHPGESADPIAEGYQRQVVDSTPPPPAASGRPPTRRQGHFTRSLGLIRPTTPILRPETAAAAIEAPRACRQSEASKAVPDRRPEGLAANPRGSRVHAWEA